VTSRQNIGKRSPKPSDIQYAQASSSNFRQISEITSC
jgi:hypothetical protein